MRRYFVANDGKVSRLIWRQDLDEEAIRLVTVPHIYDFEPTTEISHGVADGAFMGLLDPLTLPPLQPDRGLLIDGLSYDFVATNFSMRWNSAQTELAGWCESLEAMLSAFLP